MNKLVEEIEHTLMQGDVKITIVSCISEDNTVTILVEDVGGKIDSDLATGVCDWDADDSLEKVLLEVLELATA